VGPKVGFVRWVWGLALVKIVSIVMENILNRWLRRLAAELPLRRLTGYSRNLTG